MGFDAHVMTFWGAERFRDTHSGHPEHEEKEQSHRPVEPHESPWVMTVPLIVLAVLSTVGGFIGVPYALANRDINVIEHTLEPVVAHVPSHEEGITAEAATGLHGSEAAAHSDVTAERLLTVVSVVIALLGIGAGWVLFQRRPLMQMPRLLENKYYVDEIYDAALIRPIETVSREGLWKIIDKGVIDGGLHSIGEAVTELGRLGRWLQAGFVRGYAAIILLGALILIGLFAYIGSTSVR